MCSAEVLPSVPKCEKIAMCLMKKLGVLDKLCSDMGYSAVSCEFNANELMIRFKYGIFKQTQIKES